MSSLTLSSHRTLQAVILLWVPVFTCCRAEPGGEKPSIEAAKKQVEKASSAKPGSNADEFPKNEREKAVPEAPEKKDARQESLDEKLGRVRKYYDSPGVIEQMLSESSWGEYQWHTRFKITDNNGKTIDEFEYLIRNARLGENTRVLDWGCGMGWFAVQLAKRFRSRVNGVNISREQLIHANELARKEGVAHRVRFDLYDGKELPYEEGHFDVVFSQEAICNAPNKRFAIGEIFRVLKPGGELFVQDWYGNESNKNWRELIKGIDAKYQTFVDSIQNSARMYKRIGFTAVKTVDARQLTGDQFVEIFAGPPFKEPVDKGAFTIGFLFAKKPL